MIHFFRRIRKQLLNNKKLSTYALYAIGEVFLVVIGILIALQINNWNNHRIERQEETRTYQNIKSQISEDRKELLEIQAFNRMTLGQLEHANRLISNKNRRAIDTLAYLVMMMSQYSDFNGNGNIYETLVNSGDLKLLKNDEIPMRIKKLENTYNRINHLEDLNWSIIIEELSKELRGVLNYESFERFEPDRIIKPNKLYSPELQNIIYEVRYLSMGKDTIYEKAIKEIDGLEEIISTEIGDNP
ncbi:MAG: DUF6090 family protein [Flavobacteriaceae bacterium]